MLIARAPFVKSLVLTSDEISHSLSRMMGEIQSGKSVELT